MPAVSKNLSEFPQGIDDRLEELRRSRAALLQEIEAAKRASAPGPSGSNAWSAAEVVYHVHLSEKSIARMLKRAMESTARSTVADGEQFRAEWERIRRLIGIGRVKMQAPPRVVPENAPDLADGVELLSESRQQLLAAIGNATYDDLLSVSTPHPFQVDRHSDRRRMADCGRLPRPATRRAGSRAGRSYQAAKRQLTAE